MRFYPFQGIRPPKELAAQVSARPYDVMSSAEARVEVNNNPLSLLRITRAETNLEETCNEHDDRVYDEAKRQYELFLQSGYLRQDAQACYYIYAQTMDGYTQYGLVVAADAADYLEGHIKRHELTRLDKEQDRMRHIQTLGAQLGPAFFIYRHREDMRQQIAQIVKEPAEYDFVSPEDGYRHRMWPISDPQQIEHISHILHDIDTMYIADGHHRSAAAAQLARQNGGGQILAVCFADDELRVFDYNRVVKDTHGLSTSELLHRLEEDFIITPIHGRGETAKPKQLHDMSLYIKGQWYSLRVKDGRYDAQDPIEVLDVSISSKLILDKQLGITDLRSDHRIDFVGGVRGLQELERRVDSGEMALAIALYPVTIEQIIRIADADQIMPPKATWFEPKLRSGIVIKKN